LLGGERVATGPAAAAPAAPAGDAGADDHIADAPIHSRFAQQPRLSPIVGKFARRLRERIDAAWQSHDDGNFEELGRFGHWLVGSAGMMGYDGLTAPARELEALAKARDRSASAAMLARLDGMCERLVVPEAIVAP